MDHDQDTGQDPPDSAEELPGDPDPQNGAANPFPPAAAAAASSAPTPTGRRSRGVRAGAGAAPAERAPGRARGKAGDIPERFDAGAPGAPKWSSHDADILWPEMIEWLTRKGRSPYDVTVNVIRVEPPPRSSVGEGFEANAAVGDGTSLTPGDAIKRIVEDYYHLPVSRTPAKYELQFVWRANSQYIAQGYLTCQSPAEIIALRNAQHARRMQQPTQQMPGLGGYSPPQQQQQVPPFVPQNHPLPQFGFPTPQYVYPPQQQSPQLPMREQLELERLRAENERLRRERDAPPRHTQPGFGAPQTRPMTEEEREERLVTRTIAALRAAGLGAPPAPAPPPNDMISGMRSALAVMKEFRRFSEDAAGVFEPEDGPPPRQLTTGAGEAPPPAAEDPYDITELPSHWGDGSQAKLVRDRETGRIDPLGLALMNPYPAQKLMDAAASFMQRFVQRPAGPGLGQPPEEIQQFDQQQSPQLQSPMAPPQEPPQSEESNGGSTDPGYDNL